MATQRYDPTTGQPIRETPAPPNTRTMLYHPALAPIVVSGDGETLQLQKASLAEKIRAKLAQGYVRERPHGQHPHSNDPARLYMQKAEAEGGDKRAQEALRAKGHTFDSAEKK